MIDVLIPILVFFAVFCTGGGIALTFRARRNLLASRLLVDDGGVAMTPEQHRSAVLRVASRFGNAFSFGRGSKSLQARLAQAGYYGEGATSAYVGLKLMLLLAGLWVTLMVVMRLELALPITIYLAMMGGALPFFLPNLVLRARLNHRRQEVRSHLPDAIDLLEVCVSSGMGLDMAWNSVADEIRRVSGVMADEMALANLEMQLGATRTDSLRHMAERTGAEECSSLVAMMVQSERFGTSISDALGTFASAMRESRSQHAEERAEKMAVKLLFPLVLFIFPVMLIVMVGPTAITLAKIFADGG